MSYRLWKKSLIILFYIFTFSAIAEETEDNTYAMNNDRLDTLIRRLDKKPDVRDGIWELKIGNHAVTVITDENSDRMRIVIPITETAELSEKKLYRIMQANFDSALDARYAIAKEILWSAFIHPLSTLTDEEFLNGLGQAVNLVDTYGSTYSSGAETFVGGDSNNLNEKELIKDLLKQGKAI